MGSLYLPVTEAAEDQKLKDVKFKSINLLKVSSKIKKSFVFTVLTNPFQAALLELEFLKEVDQAGYLYDRAHVHRAVYRRG